MKDLYKKVMNHEWLDTMNDKVSELIIENPFLSIKWSLS